MLPIYVAYETGLSQFEQECVREAAKDFERAFPESKVFIYGDEPWDEGEFSSADWYINRAKKVWCPNSRVRLDADSVINMMMFEPWQRVNPHIDILVTLYDLSVRGTQDICFCVVRGRIVVQSLYRYRKLRQQTQRRAIKTSLWRAMMDSSFGNK